MQRESVGHTPNQYWPRGEGNGASIDLWIHLASWVLGGGGGGGGERGVDRWRVNEDDYSEGKILLLFRCRLYMVPVCVYVFVYV